MQDKQLQRDRHDEYGRTIQLVKVPAPPGPIGPLQLFQKFSSSLRCVPIASLMEAASESLLANQATTTTVYGSAALEQSAGDIEPPHVRGRIKMLFAALIFVQVRMSILIDCLLRASLLIPFPSLTSSFTGNVEL
jgi:hypothetical protein